MTDIPEIKYKATIFKKGFLWFCVVEKAYQSADYYADNKKYCKVWESLPVFVSLTKRGIYKKVQKWKENNDANG